MFASGRINFMRRIFQRFRLSSRSLKLRSIDWCRQNTADFTGRLTDVDVKLDGGWFEPKGSIQFNLEDIEAKQHKFGRGKVQIDLDDGTADLDADFASAGMWFNSRVGLSYDLPYSARFVFKSAKLPTWIGLFLNVEQRGVADVRANIEGSLRNIRKTNGDISVKSLQSHTYNLKFNLLKPTVLKLEQGVLHLKKVSLGGGDLRLMASGKISPSQLDLKLDGRLNLSKITKFLPGVERPAGYLSFVGYVGHSKNGWDVAGSGRVAGASFEYRGVPGRISQIRTEFNFSHSSLLMENLTALWAGGRIRANAQMSLDGWKPRHVKLGMLVDGAKPNLSFDWMDLTARLDGRIDVFGKWPKVGVLGDINVSRARVTPRTDLSNLIDVRTLPYAYDPSAEVLNVDIALHLTDKLRARNADLDVELTGDLRLTGTNERFGLLGSLSLERGGRVSFVGREYTTESGVIEFREKLRFHPRFDLSLWTRACDARIDLSLVGTLEELDPEYRSNPAMDREDIVSCLVRGIKRDNLDDDLASFAGTAILKLSGVDRQVKRVLPIDQIEVTTEFSAIEKGYEPRLLVAKDLILLEKTVRLEYSRSLSLLKDEEQRAALRVRLAPRLSLQLGWASSEQISFGDWGIDLKRRWEW